MFRLTVMAPMAESIEAEAGRGHKDGLSSSFLAVEDFCNSNWERWMVSNGAFFMRKY